MSDVRVLHADELGDRVYLAKQGPDVEEDLAAIWELMREHGFSKAFARIDDRRERRFTWAGFRSEARVSLPDGRALVFCGAYSDRGRATESRPLDVVRAFDAARRAASSVTGPPTLPLRRAGAQDAETLAAFYAAQFESYPFPIRDATFVRQAIEEGSTRFMVAEDDDGIAAAASAELDASTGTCELTDFATDERARGRGLAGALLDALEHEMRSECHTAYTIARATAPGINVVFSRAGYTYGGRLVNNTHIGGAIESMNVWYRRLS